MEFVSLKDLCVELTVGNWMQLLTKQINLRPTNQPTNERKNGLISFKRCVTFGNRVWRLEFGPNMSTIRILDFAWMYWHLTKRAFDRTGQ